MTKMKNLKLRWKQFYAHLNNFALAMDYDPERSSHHRIRLLEQELGSLSAKLDHIEAKQTDSTK